MTAAKQSPVYAVGGALHETLDRQVFTAIAEALGHTKATLDGDAEARLRLLAATTTIRALIREDLQDGLADDLYAAAHEHCTDRCYGGGKNWHADIAKLLVDPHGPMAAIAEELHRFHRAGGPRHDLEHWHRQLRQGFTLPAGSRRDTIFRLAWVGIGATAAAALEPGQNGATSEGTNRG